MLELRLAEHLARLFAHSTLKKLFVSDSLIAGIRDHLFVDFSFQRKRCDVHILGLLLLLLLLLALIGPRGRVAAATAAARAAAGILFGRLVVLRGVIGGVVLDGFRVNHSHRLILFHV